MLKDLVAGAILAYVGIVCSLRDSFHKEKEPIRPVNGSIKAYAYPGDDNESIYVYYSTSNNKPIHNIKTYNLECLKERGYHIKTYNLECLKERGYHIKNEAPSYRSHTIHTVTRKSNEHTLNLDEFMNDCEKCKVHTKITYKDSPTQEREIDPWKKRYFIREPGSPYNIIFF